VPDPRLVALLRDRSVRTGSFVLASGRTSDLYVDARQTTLHADGARWVAEAMLDALPADVVAVGGLTLGADPVACSIAALSTLRGRPIHAFLVRKEPKAHGAGHAIEGLANVPPGSAVAVVEDTTTTGGSLLKAVDAVVAAGLRVAAVLTVVDREEGATEALAARGLSLVALVRRSDLVPS
jgi:orotate phosphoribosyltransferase